MATLDLSSVNFGLLGAMALGKLFVFVLAAGAALLLEKENKLSKAGVYGVFCTQSNDLAFGFPIVNALYPNLVQYLYLGAPFQLVVLTPLGFVLMEAGNPNAKSGSVCSKAARIAKVSGVMRVVIPIAYILHVSLL